MAEFLYTEIICRYGAPRSILTDRGQPFMAKVVVEICKIFQITKLSTCAYSPQSNGQVERMNSSLNKTLRNYCEMENQSTWDKVLSSFLLAYRSTVATRSTRYSPHFLLFGYESRLPVDVALIPAAGRGRSTEQYVRNLLEQFEIYRSTAKENAQAAKDANKEYYDRVHKVGNMLYAPGDKVWLFDSITRS